MDSWKNTGEENNGGFPPGICLIVPFSRILHKTLKKTIKIDFLSWNFLQLFDKDFYDYLQKWGVPPATICFRIHRFWGKVTEGEPNDPPTPFDKPWLLPQTTLHTHARRTFCTSVC